MPRDRVVPQSEVIRDILLEDSPCCGVPHPVVAAEGGRVAAGGLVPAPGVGRYAAEQVARLDLGGRFGSGLAYSCSRGSSQGLQL